MKTGMKEKDSEEINKEGRKREREKKVMKDK